MVKDSILMMNTDIFLNKKAIKINLMASLSDLALYFINIP